MVRSHYLAFWSCRLSGRTFDFQSSNRSSILRKTITTERYSRCFHYLPGIRGNRNCWILQISTVTQNQSVAATISTCIVVYQGGTLSQLALEDLQILDVPDVNTSKGVWK